jgi:hypothetical protein
LTQLTQDDLDNLPPQPSQPPRAITKNARRRSWAEPRVRNWWFMSLAIFLIALAFVGARVYASLSDRALIKHGVRVEADILDVEGNTLKKLYTPEENLRFHLSWRMPDGRVHTVNERLKAQRGAIGPGKKVPLYVDPKNPSRWTDRTEISWAEDTLMGMLLLPIILLLLSISLFNRYQTLQAWKNGPSIHASVVEIKQSATAPLSRVLRMVLANYHDQRIFTTLIPTRLARYQPGDIVWVIIPSTTPRWAILAELYE